LFWCSECQSVCNFVFFDVKWLFQRPVLDAMLVNPHDFFFWCEETPKVHSDVNETALKLWCNVEILFLMWCSFPEVFLITFLISFLWRWFDVFLMQWKWPEDFLMIEVGPFVFFDVAARSLFWWSRSDVWWLMYWCPKFFSDVNLTLFADLDFNKFVDSWFVFADAILILCCGDDLCLLCDLLVLEDWV